MNRFVTRGLALGLFILAVSPVFAQRQPGGGGFGFGGGAGGEKTVGFLVTNKSVQEELKLTDDQIAKFKTANEGVREKFKDELKEAGKDREKMTAVRKTMAEETNKVMTKTMDENLKPEQIKRLKQIKWQANGARALASDTEVQKTLKLTESQIGEIKAIQDDAQKDITEAMKGVRPTQGGGRPDADKIAEAQKKVTEINKETSEKSMGKLTPAQKKQWEEIIGPKFELKIEPRGPRPTT